MGRQESPLRSKNPISPADSVQPILDDELVKNLAKVAKKIGTFTATDFGGEELFLPATHLLKSPGKMLRPALVLLCAKVAGEDESQFIDLAAAAELLHVASLVHDDIIDGDASRRGVEAVHARYGSEAAILAGDALISKAILLASKYGQKVMDEMASSAMEMCQGELVDYNYQRLGRAESLETYLRVAKLKTASFIGTCCSVAAAYGGSPAAKRLANFGRYMGLAFQIKDDLEEANGAGRQGIVAAISSSKMVSSEDAVKKAVEMNNYFYSKALSQIKDMSMRMELERYTSFIKISSSQ